MTYRFGQERGERMRRDQCPPHPGSELYDTSDLDGRPQVRCRRCFHLVATGTLAALEADPVRFKEALR